jgi:hypothetical protein
MEQTEHFAMVDGVHCRIWNGVTEDDKQCFVFVHTIASREEISSLLNKLPPEEIIPSD